MLSKIRSKLTHAKVFMHRALTYASIINMALILFLALSNLEKYGMDIRLETWGIPIFILLIVMLVLLGFLEDRLGFFEEEQKVTAKRNPHLNEIIKRLDRIEKKLK
ncbi:hypothetical protein GOV09_01220 [Candidatus Woesearchaeota archaeon]|nr:hypothetical protein [Candidatus Woesearchaeota archaeon]